MKAKYFTSWAGVLTFLTLGSLPLAGAAAEVTSGAPIGSTPSTNKVVAEVKPIPRYDLDFNGGTAEELLQVIEKASGQKVNAIIPEEDKGYIIPAFNVRQVTVEDLFTALEQASNRTVTYTTGTYFSTGRGSQPQYASATVSAGFRRQGNVWVFRVIKPNKPPVDAEAKGTRFYQLEPFFPKYSIEDITTAIQTAWQMMGKTKATTANGLKFHQETKLLIAVGDESQLQVIDDVLKALVPEPKTRPAAPVEDAFKLKP